VIGRIARAVLVAVLGVAVACTTSTAPKSASPTPNAAIVNADPTKVIVGVADVPAGYRLEGEQPLAADAMSGRSDKWIVPDQVLQGGFVGGTSRLFTLDADGMADRVAAVYLLKYKDGEAAGVALEASTPKETWISRTSIGEAIGDNAHAYRWRETSGDGSESIMIQFQYGNAVSYVVVQGVPSSAPMMREVVAIAQKQAGLLQADAVGPAIATPQPRTQPVTRTSADLALRVNDLPAGFTTDTSVALAVEDLSEDDADLAFWKDAGFRRGWATVFDAPDGGVQVTSVVVILAQTKTADAFQYLAKGGRSSPGVYEISTGQILGDESLALEAKGTMQGTALTYRRVLFRYGDSLGWVQVEGRGGVVEATFVIDLVTKLISHLN
jgi:hypothetical protein